VQRWCLTVPADEHVLERRYAAQVVLGTILGLNVEVIARGAGLPQLALVGDDRLVLEFRDDFFRWWRGCADTRDPLLELRPVTTASGAQPTQSVLWLALEAQEGRWLSVDEFSHRLSVDVFGMAFALLSGLDDYLTSDRDTHDRMPDSSSFAIRLGAARRPIVDELAGILLEAMNLSWPHVERQLRTSRVVSTHDVDTPLLSAGQRMGAVLRSVLSVARHTPLGRDTMEAASMLAGALRNRRVDRFASDPWWTFPYILERCFASGVKPEIYFITDPVETMRSRVYNMTDPPISTLVAMVSDAGASAGVHASYPSHGDTIQLNAEATRLVHHAGDAGVRGGRHHYLRWNARVSPDAWEDAGMEFDSSVGFTSHCGFRSGTSHPHPLYSFARRRATTVIERPLVVMERCIEREVGIAGPYASALLGELRDQCFRHGGDFVFLFHNNSLAQRRQRRLFEQCLGGDQDYAPRRSDALS
jgi:hypothetical protein